MTTSAVPMVVEAMGKEILDGVHSFYTEGRPQCGFVRPSPLDPGEWWGYWLWIIAGKIVVSGFKVPPINLRNRQYGSQLREVMEAALFELRSKVEQALYGIGAIDDGGELSRPPSSEPTA